MIDGGKGQLAAALESMQAYDLPRVAVIALAKRIEEVFVPGQPDPIVLSRHSAGAAAAAADPRRGAPVRRRLPPAAARGARLRLDLRRPRRRRAGPAARAAPPLRLGRGDARRDAGGARGRSRRPARDRAPHLRAAAQSGTGIEPRPATGPREALRLIGSRNFGPFFAGNAASATGTWFQNLAAALFVYRLTHSAFLLGVLAFSNFIPVLLLAPWTGSAATDSTGRSCCSRRRSPRSH